MVKSEKQKKNQSDANDISEQGKAKALELAVSQIEKQFGKGSIMKLDNNIKESVPAISTGAISLDIALGIGGVPRGRVIEIFGPESSGKTTLTLSIIAQVQKTAGVAAFIDAENAFDSSYASKIGVNLDDLLISQPDDGEQALEIAETLVRSNAVDVIVIDSVAALVPRAEIEGAMGQPQMGLQARLMSQALRKLSGAISKSKTCVIFINQIREKIGIMFGNPETTPGGRALKFYSSVRLDIRRKEYMKSGDVIVGSLVKAKVVKNKVAAPFRSAEFEIMYAEGISREGSLLDVAVNFNILQKQGAWFSYGDTKIGQGRESARIYLKENPRIALEIEKKVKEQAAKA
jgi:recombination protein RecA